MKTILYITTSIFIFVIIISLINSVFIPSQSEPTNQPLARSLTSSEITPESSVSPSNEPKTSKTTLATAPLVSNTDLYVVVKVIDGDTIDINYHGKIERVRYIGIDTPETVDPRNPVQCFGKEANKKNSELVLNKKVRLEKDITDRDRYGRLLRYVYVGDQFINLDLVKLGYAKVYTYPPDVKYNQMLLNAQRTAQNTNSGLWRACKTTQTVQSPTPIDSSPIVSQNPAECNIKGNISSGKEKIYHLTGCDSYEKTTIDESMGERWFCSEQEALNAGWRKALNCH